jgi:hypothetical protein
VVEDCDIEHSDCVTMEDKHVSHPEARPDLEGAGGDHPGPRERQWPSNVRTGPEGAYALLHKQE